MPRGPRIWQRVRGLWMTLSAALFGVSALAMLIVFASQVAPARGALREHEHEPVEVHSQQYISSNECRSCHPSEYASWHETYHRRMTQQTTPDTVLGAFDNVLLGEKPSYLLSHNEQGYFVEVLAADGGREPHAIPIVTGSHHMQIYWYESGEDRSLTQLPFVYLKADRRWVPRSAIFIEPPRAAHAESKGRWNVSCIACHTTLGQPRVDAQGKFDTQVAELGIACEACHGPGEQHVARYRSPLARYTRHFSAQADDSITQPKRLTHERSSLVCGQCHSTWLFDGPTGAREWNKNGPAYRPGSEGLSAAWLVQPSRANVDARIAGYLAYDPKTVASQFWSDGMMRVSGREYNGLVDSPCYAHGELSCASCHSMHQHADDKRPSAQWRDAQLSADMDGDRGCLQCHTQLAQAPEKHTQHAAGSVGSRCYNCHMPYTSYGLLKALRSHRIDSPNIAATARTGRPNACNLCHLDKTLAWTAQQLEQKFGVSSEEVSGDLADNPVALVLALRGDAGQRALIAWALGWAPARAAAEASFAPALLAQLLDDPYTAVRYISLRSLRQRGLAPDALEYDFVTDPATRKPVAQRVAQLLSPELSLEQQAAQRARFEPFLSARDDHPMQLLE